MANRNPLFSIIIPFTNCDEFLMQAIDTVMLQTYQGFELLLIDDTGTFELDIKSLKLPEDNVHYFKNNSLSGGGYSARNIGLDKAKGDWIAFLDADDLWSPRQLQTYLDLIESTHDVSLICTNWIVSGSDVVPIVKGMKPKARKRGTLTFPQLLKKLESGADFFNTNVTCINRKLLTEELKFPEFQARCMSSGDGKFWFMYLKSNIRTRIAWDSVAGAVYWQHKQHRASQAGRYLHDNCYLNYLIEIIESEHSELDDQMRLSVEKILSAKCASRLIRVKITESFTIREYRAYLKHILFTHKYGFIVFLRYIYLKLRNVFNTYP